MALAEEPLRYLRKYLNVEVWNSVPDKLGSRYVVTHFASAKPKAPLPVQEAVKYVEPLEEYADEKTPDIASLIRELERLEKVCRGSNTLQDIFYEVHDGKNAVTNLRMQYPQVADAMEDLLRVYGFDVIYEELDG